MILFSDRGCPFAHRVLALINHLGCPVERRESLVGDKPAGIERYSASGAIPLLVDGDLVLTESRVMLAYLAERHGMPEVSEDPVGRILHHHAMAVVDSTLAPALFGSRALAGPRLQDALDALTAATHTVAPGPCLLAFHTAPFWLRFRMLRPDSAVTEAIEARPALCSWLDAAVQLPAVQATAPDPVTHAEDVRRASAAGLISPNLTLTKSAS